MPADSRDAGNHADHSTIERSAPPIDEAAPVTLNQAGDNVNEAFAEGAFSAPSTSTWTSLAASPEALYRPLEDAKTVFLGSAPIFPPKLGLEEPREQLVPRTEQATASKAANLQLAPERSQWTAENSDGMTMDRARVLANALFERDPSKMALYWPMGWKGPLTCDADGLISALEAELKDDNKRWRGTGEFLAALRGGKGDEYVEDSRRSAVSGLAKSLFDGQPRALDEARRNGLLE